jgi:hypothetical protein
MMVTPIQLITENGYGSSLSKLAPGGDHFHKRDDAHDLEISYQVPTTASLPAICDELEDDLASLCSEISDMSGGSHDDEISEHETVAVDDETSMAGRYCSTLVPSKVDGNHHETNAHPDTTMAQKYRSLDEHVSVVAARRHASDSELQASAREVDRQVTHSNKSTQCGTASLCSIDLQAPHCLTVEVPKGLSAVSAHAGQYEVVPGVRPNGFPLWKHVDTHHWIFGGTQGMVLFGGEDEALRNFQCSDGLVASTEPRCGINADVLDWQLGPVAKVWHVIHDLKSAKGGLCPKRVRAAGNGSQTTMSIVLIHHSSGSP